MFTEYDLVLLMVDYGWLVYAPIIIAAFWVVIVDREVKLLHAKERRDGHR